MEGNLENNKKHPDRPLDCSECRKPITVHYTEIVGESTIHIGMCADCPQLQRRLRGEVKDDKMVSPGGITAGLACGECGSTLDNFRINRKVGCSNCYDVFSNVIIEDMIKSNRIFPGIIKQKKSVPLHVGRSPGETQEISPSLRLIALNEALEETLKSEDYEQAAWLRDQIKALTEDTENRNDKGE